jgi:hypothetical protein
VHEHKAKRGARIMAAMITTVDNPIDPREDFDRWYTWDVQNGYNTCAYLSRIAFLLPDDPEELNDHQIEAAIDEIIAIHDDGMYKKLPITDAA